LLHQGGQSPVEQAAVGFGEQLPGRRQLLGIDRGRNSHTSHATKHSITGFGAPAETARDTLETTIAWSADVAVQQHEPSGTPGPGHVPS
jgi:hypothetical protein